MDGSRKGKILRVRIGHEANCSSGMMAMVFLVYGSGVYLLISGIASAVYALRAGMAEGDEQGGKMPIGFWVFPQLLGLVLTVFLGWIAFADNAAILTLGAVAMSVFLALSTGVGYVLMQRVRHPVLLIGVALLVPLIFLICPVILVQVVWGAWLWDIF